MSVADRRGTVGASAFWLQTWPRRYGFALIAVIVASLLRYVLGVTFGFSQHFILFYPTLMLVALLGGFGPGLFATLLSAAITAYFFLEPLHSFAIRRPRDIVSITLFGVMGATISSLGEVFRRRSKRLQEFEKAVEGLEEMIVVVDRDYRYVIANRAYLNFRNMEKADLVGRLASEILSPGVFETTVKAKLDECFAGKIVQYEMRYTYPVRGERELFITYFPIEGRNGVERVACVLQDVTEQKVAERSLKLFRTLIDQSNEAVEVVDPETLRFLDVNEKTCKDLGYTREELLTMTVFDINPYIDESTSAKVRERLRESGSFVREGFHQRKDGTMFPVETSLNFVQLDRAYVVAFSRDISDRKRVEDALGESEDRYRDLVEHSEDLVCTHDLEGRLLSVNPTPARLLGYEVDEFLKIPMRELIAPEYRGMFDEYLVRIKATGADKGLLCVLTRGGEQRIWEYNNTLRTEGVATPIVRGMAHDVTEKRLAELARTKAELSLAESEERFRVALKDSPITVFTQDLDLRYTWIYNPQLYWQREVIGKTDEEIVGPKKAAVLVDLKRRVLRGGVAVREDVEIMHEGRNYAFDMTIEPLFGADGSVIGITGASMDIARFREMADRLQDARDKLVQEKSYLESEIQSELGFEEIIGQSPALREVLKKARVVAPTDSTVLLLGETGTGKELMARSVHSLSSRRDKTFIKLNCAAVPSGLLESCQGRHRAERHRPCARHGRCRRAGGDPQCHGDGQRQGALDDRGGRAVQDGGPRSDHRCGAGWPACARQRDQRGGGSDQADRFPRRGASKHSGGARSRGGQHAGEEPVVPGACRCRRHCTWSACADYPDQPR